MNVYHDIPNGFEPSDLRPLSGALQAGQTVVIDGAFGLFRARLTTLEVTRAEWESNSLVGWIDFQGGHWHARHFMAKQADWNTIVM